MINAVLKEDLEIISQAHLPFDELKDKDIVVTGATGLIGSLLVKSLLFCNKKYKLNLKVIAAVRNVEKAQQIYSDFLDDKLVLYKWDIKNDIFNYNGNVDYIIHTAAVTKSKEMLERPVDNIKISMLGTMQILDYAIANAVKKMIYISSMEMYGTFENLTGTVTEEQLGYIDIKSARSCYPEGKRMCECLCNAYWHQYHLPVNCMRLAQTFGAGTLQGENRVFAQFARSVIEKKDIVLHTAGGSEGNYVYSRDAITAILTALLKGKEGEAYNVANMSNHMTVVEMAHLVAEKVAHGKIKVVFDIPENNVYGYAPETKLFLNSNKLCDLGWTPEIGLEEAYNIYIAYLKEEMKNA